MVDTIIGNEKELWSVVFRSLALRKGFVFCPQFIIQEANLFYNSGGKKIL
jgi:hypothetical protein